MRERNKLLSTFTPPIWDIFVIAAEPVSEFTEAQVREDGSLTLDSSLGVGKRRSTHCSCHANKTGQLCARALTDVELRDEECNTALWL